MMFDLDLRLRGLMLAGLLALSPIASSDEPDPAWPEDGPDGAAPSHDFELPTQGCHAETLAGAIGGALGGFVASRIGDGDGRAAAVAAGSVIGYILGAAIGRSFDETNSECAPRAPERARTERTANT